METDRRCFPAGCLPDIYALRIIPYPVSQEDDKNGCRNYKSHDLGEDAADDLVRDFRDEYQGEYDDEADFAYEIVEECYDLPEFAKTYFDYKQFARDLFMCEYWSVSYTHL